MQENICFTTYEIQLEIILSYPVHRKKRLEYRLQHVTNSADLERSYAELSLLQTVIQQGNPFCNECIFDCLKCSWVRNPADQPVADHAMN